MRKNKRNGIKHLLAAMLFCMVMSMGMVSLADVKGTVIAKSAVIRESADPNSKKLASVPSGKTIDIISQTKGTDNLYWYQVYVDANTKGYIRGDLIKVPDGTNIPTTQGGSAAPSQSADAPTTANPVEARQVSVISNNTNIRAAASTTSESRGKVNRGMVLTVTGETTGSDNKTWYQVTFTNNNEEKTGFVRSDLVTSDIPADAATSQITGEENPEEQPTEQAPEEAPPEQPAESAPVESNNVIPMNVDEEPYIMPGFTPAVIKVSEEEKYNAYRNGTFFILYGQKQNGEQGWYLFDSVNHVYQQYVYTAEGVTMPDEGSGVVGLIPVIVLVVIIIVLVAVVGMLLIRLKGQSTSHKRYRSYDDDDDQDDDIEDLEDMEDDDEPQPIRRPQGQQPPRRPQGGAVSNVQQGQPPRRPQGQQPPRHPQGQQPPRRMQGNPQNGNAPQGGQQPPRRPQGGSPSNNNNGGARPQGGQQPPRRPQGGQQPPRRPQSPNERIPGDKGQAQKGYKAKNLLEDDDMDFMDIE